MLIKLCLCFVIITTLDQTQGSIYNGKDLHVSEINESSFEVFWYTGAFKNAKNYTVILNKIEECNNNSYVVTCKEFKCSFTLSDYCNPTSPCTDVTVRVTGQGFSSEMLEFKTGIGIDEPPLISLGDQKCSILASWNVSVCNTVDNYLLTWDDNGEIPHLTDTRYTIHDLKPGNYTVCVSAYQVSSLIGEIFCSDAFIEQVSPGATTIRHFGLENDSYVELTVLWTGPETHGCAIVDGFYITCRKVGDDSIFGHWNVSSKDTNFTITGLDQTTLYEVKVEAFSDIGKGLADYKNATTSNENEPEKSDSIILVIVVPVVVGLIVIALIGTSIYVFVAKHKKDRKVGLYGPAADIPMNKLDRTQNQDSRNAPEGVFNEPPNQDHYTLKAPIVPATNERSAIARDNFSVQPAKNAIPRAQYARYPPSDIEHFTSTTTRYSDKPARYQLSDSEDSSSTFSYF